MQRGHTDPVLRDKKSLDKEHPIGVDAKVDREGGGGGVRGLSND